MNRPTAEWDKGSAHHTRIVLAGRTDLDGRLYRLGESTAKGTAQPDSGELEARTRETALVPASEERGRSQFDDLGGGGLVPRTTGRRQSVPVRGTQSAVVCPCWIDGRGVHDWLRQHLCGRPPRTIAGFVWELAPPTGCPGHRRCPAGLYLCPGGLRNTTAALSLATVAIRYNEWGHLWRSYPFEEEEGFCHQSKLNTSAVLNLVNIAA